LARSTDETSASCEKYRALARSEASLLFAPKVGVQFLRLPKAGTVSADGTSELGDRNQVRAYLAYSLLDLYRGKATLDIGDLDCKRAAAEVQLREAIELGQSQGKAPAIRKSLAFLNQHVERIHELIQAVEERFGRGRMTLSQLDDVHRDVEQFFQRRLALLEELSLIDAKSTGSSDSSSILILASEYRSRDLEREKAASRLRRTRPWDVMLRGGVIPTSDRDYFGAVEVTYNFGQLFQSNAEQDYLNARQRELEKSKHDPAQDAARVQEYQKRSIPILEDELSLREQMLVRLKHHESVLRSSENVDTPNLLAEVEVRRILAEADAIYLRELISQRSASVNGKSHVEAK
jgi:hypothetical protein